MKQWFRWYKLDSKGVDGLKEQEDQREEKRKARHALFAKHRTGGMALDPFGLRVRCVRESRRARKYILARGYRRRCCIR